MNVKDNVMFAQKKRPFHPSPSCWVLFCLTPLINKVVGFILDQKRACVVAGEGTYGTITVNEFTLTMISVSSEMESAAADVLLGAIQPSRNNGSTQRLPEERTITARGPCKLLRNKRSRRLTVYKKAKS